jgi:hypothetical protein
MAEATGEPSIIGTASPKHGFDRHKQAMPKEQGCTVY